MRRRRFLAALAVAGLARGQRRADGEEVWRQYVEWNTGRPRQSLFPGEDYREWLLSNGVHQAQADQQVQLIRSRLLYRPNAWPEWFDHAYSNPDIIFEPQPNELLARVVEDVPPGKALDVAMGQGRNAVYLAGKGWQVTGFDVSSVGLAMARAKAARAGVSVNTVLAGFDSFAYGQESWDLVVMMYAFVPLKEKLVDRIVDSLKSGGLLVYEHLMSDSETALWVTLGGIGMPKPGALRQAFDGLEILRYEEVRARPDWGPVKPSPVARLVARKP